MLFTEQANQIFNRAIADYHVTDHVDTPIHNPYPKDSIEYSLYLKCWIDTVQWHFEDLIRDPHIDPTEALLLKRRIDKSNQDRTDLVEEIDSWFRQHYSEVKVLPEARLNTESPPSLGHRPSEHPRPEDLSHAGTSGASGCLPGAHRQVSGKAQCAVGATERPLAGHRPVAGGYRGWTEVYEGLPSDEDVQRPLHQSCAL